MMAMKAEAVIFFPFGFNTAVALTLGQIFLKGR